MNILQKEDFADVSFANDDTNAQAGLVVRTDAGSTVGDAIQAAKVWVQDGAGAVPRTLDDKGYDTVSIFDFMTPAEKTDVKSNAATLDVTAALQAAADHAELTKRTLHGDVGTAKVSSTLNLRCNGDLAGLTVVADATAVSPAVRFGSVLGAPTTGKFIKLPNVRNTARASGTWGTGIGVELANCDTNIIVTAAINEFEHGLYAGGRTSGFAYNTVFLGRIYSNKINVSVVPLGAPGWSNQNTFIGGRLGFNSTDFTVSGYAGTRNIVLGKGPASSGGANNNTFIGTSVESDVVEYTIEFNESAGYNRFIALRYEGTTQKVLFHTDTPSGIVYNVFEGGYGGQNVDFVYTGTGSAPYNSMMSGNNNAFDGTGSIIDIVNNLSNGRTAPHIQGFSAGVPALDRDHTSLDWVYRLYAQGFAGKRSTDTNTRLNLDFQNGRIYFDNGTTVTQTAYIGSLGADNIGISKTFHPATTNTLDLGTTAFRWRTAYLASISLGATNATWTPGSGSPEGVLAAPVGSMYTRTDGGANTTLYVKESGAGNTGWVAK